MSYLNDWTRNKLCKSFGSVFSVQQREDYIIYAAAFQKRLNTNMNESM